MCCPIWWTFFGIWWTFFLSVEIFFGSFTMFVSPCVYECNVQYGGLSLVSGGLKGFSRICCDVGVELR